MNEELRSRLVAKIRAQHEQHADAPPLVTLDEYFTGNSDEECIAPNQAGDGRPELKAFYQHFAEIQRKPNVAAVLVGIHGDWEYNEEKGWKNWPPAENIHIYTSAEQNDVDEWIEGLASDGAGEGWPYGKHPSADEPPKGFKVYTVYWD